MAPHSPPHPSSFPSSHSLEDVIGEMLSLQKALPPRPSFPELEIAISAIDKAEEALSAQKEEILRRTRVACYCVGCLMGMAQMGTMWQEG